MFAKELYEYLDSSNVETVGFVESARKEK